MKMSLTMLLEGTSASKSEKITSLQLNSQTVLPMDLQISWKAAIAAFSNSALLQAELIWLLTLPESEPQMREKSDGSD